MRCHQTHIVVYTTPICNLQNLGKSHDYKASLLDGLLPAQRSHVAPEEAEYRHEPLILQVPPTCQRDWHALLDVQAPQHLLLVTPAHKLLLGHCPAPPGCSLCSAGIYTLQHPLAAFSICTLQGSMTLQAHSAACQSSAPNLPVLQLSVTSWRDSIELLLGLGPRQSLGKAAQRRCGRPGRAPRLSRWAIPSNFENILDISQARAFQQPEDQA